MLFAAVILCCCWWGMKRSDAKAAAKRAAGRSGLQNKMADPGVVAEVRRVIDQAVIAERTRLTIQHDELMAEERADGIVRDV